MSKRTDHAFTLSYHHQYASVGNFRANIPAHLAVRASFAQSSSRPINGRNIENT